MKTLRQIFELCRLSLLSLPQRAGSVGVIVVGIAGVVGVLVSRWVARIKVDKHPAFAMHWLYWHLPSSPLTAMQATPPSHIRRMVG
jgi:type IV conjugative transfer system protein TraL